MELAIAAMDDSYVDTHGGATNIGDDTLGSGVAYEVECVPNLAFDGVAEADEENPGGLLCVNDDDDDGSGVADRDDAGATIGEDDLRALSMDVGTLDATVTLTLSAPMGGSMIKVYQNADRSMPLTLPASWPGDAVPSMLYVEGVAASAAAGDVELTLEAADAAGAMCADSVKITVVGLTIVSPADTNGNLIIDDFDNEFVYSPDEPGMLTVPIRAQIAPDVAELRAQLTNERVQSVLTPIADSHDSQQTVMLAWDLPVTGNPFAGGLIYTGSSWEATATFAGLPISNADFGPKTARVVVLDSSGAIVCDKTVGYEVFFLPLVRNNPGPMPDDIPIAIDQNQVEVRRRQE